MDRLDRVSCFLLGAMLMGLICVIQAKYVYRMTEWAQHHDDRERQKMEITKLASEIKTLTLNVRALDGTVSGLQNGLASKLHELEQACR